MTNIKTQIRLGDRVRSFDFESHDLTGERACFVEGVVNGFVELDGCRRYRIDVTRRVFGGAEVRFSGAETVYPPVNGTPTWLGRVCDGVERIDGPCPRCGHDVLTEARAEWLAADRAFDGGEFSDAHQPEFCCCPPPPDAQGFRQSSDGAATIWAVVNFEPGIPPEVMLEQARWVVELGDTHFRTPHRAAHAGAGGADEVSYRAGRTRVLVTQHVYLDI